MDISLSVPDLQSAIGVHYTARLDRLHPDTQGHLYRAFGYASPVQRIAEYGEALYAARDDLEAPDWILVAQAAHLCGLRGFSLYDYEDGPEGRGGRMFQAARRELGEPGADQDPELDPEPRADLAPDRPPEEPEEEPE